MKFHLDNVHRLNFFVILDGRILISVTRHREFKTSPMLPRLFILMELSVGRDKDLSQRFVLLLGCVVCHLID